MTEQREMEAVIEAILFVANEPVPRAKLLEVFEGIDNDAVAQAVEAVVERYREDPSRGVMVDEVAGGLRLVSRPDLHGYLRRFFEVTGSNKLSMPALESLAIIAYRQPVTAPEIQELRGVNSSGVLKKLLERRLIRIAGRKEVVGKPFLYATTREFLQHFGLRNLKELPPLEQFEELFGSDTMAAPEGAEPDPEEVADREAADIAERESEAYDRAEADAIDAERSANEKAQAEAEDAEEEESKEEETEAKQAEAQETEQAADGQGESEDSEQPEASVMPAEDLAASTPSEGGDTEAAASGPLEEPAEPHDEAESTAKEPAEVLA